MNEGLNTSQSCSGQAHRLGSERDCCTNRISGTSRIFTVSGYTEDLLAIIVAHTLNKTISGILTDRHSRADGANQLASDHHSDLVLNATSPQLLHQQDLCHMVCTPRTAVFEDSRAGPTPPSSPSYFREEVAIHN